MLSVSAHISVPLDEIELSPIRAQGAGGQNVNKVSSAIHLRFDIPASSLPIKVKERLLMFKDSRISKDGILVIKAQQFRTQEQNREDALQRLSDFINEATKVQKKRVATRPSLNSKKRRLDQKNRRGKIKALRGRIDD